MFNTLATMSSPPRHENIDPQSNVQPKKKRCQIMCQAMLLDSICWRWIIAKSGLLVKPRVDFVKSCQAPIVPGNESFSSFQWWTNRRAFSIVLHELGSNFVTRVYLVVLWLFEQVAFACASPINCHAQCLTCPWIVKRLHIFPIQCIGLNNLIAFLLSAPYAPSHTTM